MRVVIADDSVLFREGLARVLVEHGHRVEHAVGDVASLLRVVAADRPDLAVVDIRMPPAPTAMGGQPPIDAGPGSGTDGDPDGAEAAVVIRAEHPATAVLLLSQHIELRHCVGLIGTDGFGYLLKDRVLDLAEFDAAARRVAAGGSALDPEIVRALVRSQSAPPAVAGLTVREREVLALVAQGLSNVAIAARLHLSDRTVEAHMRSVFTRLGLHDDGGTHRRVLAVLRYLDVRLGPVAESGSVP